MGKITFLGGFGGLKSMTKNEWKFKKNRRFYRLCCCVLLITRLTSRLIDTSHLLVLFDFWSPSRPPSQSLPELSLFPRNTTNFHLWPRNATTDRHSFCPSQGGDKMASQHFNIQWKLQVENAVLAIIFCSLLCCFWKYHHSPQLQPTQLVAANSYFPRICPIRTHVQVRVVCINVQENLLVGAAL